MKHIQTHGLEFIEFAASDAHDIEHCMDRFGFAMVGEHKHKSVSLFQQNDINLIVNHGQNPSSARKFVEQHGPSAFAVAFRVDNVYEALRLASEHGATVVQEPVGPMELNIPAIRGVGGTLIYLVDRYGDQTIYDVDFDLDTNSFNHVSGHINRVDHITQNVEAGTLEQHVQFYRDLFGFREIQHFSIRGRHSGLESSALSSPDGKIKIPLNEPTDAKSQIREFLDEFKGEGVQHIAFHTEDIFASVDRYRKLGGEFQTTPSSYYDQLAYRVGEHSESLTKLRSSDILLDGNRLAGFLLQIFTSNVVGPMFFELIQRKGNKGFGEGNFQALFESIERDQVRRGVIDAVH